MKKEILLNGVAVGEYESTGEIRKDIKIVQKYLKENGLWKDVSIVDSMFGQAQSFAQTANELYVNKICKKPRQPSAFSPFVVNAAFSIEVYLKAIHMLYGQRKSGHSIKGLYESLNKEAKNVIADLIKKIEPEYKLEPTTKFESILNDLNYSFVQWRYLYEGNTGTIAFLPTIFVMKVLDRTCIHIKNEHNK